MSSLKLLEETLKKTGCEFSENEPMSRHTTFRIGGAAKLFCIPDNEQQLCAVTAACRESEIPFFILGNGSNLLVSDNGIKGVVISLSQRLNKISRDGNRLNALAGASLSSLCRFAAGEGLGGLEFAFGIPGSVGGAVFMNAGAYGGEMKDRVKSVKALFPNGKTVAVPAENADFGYRHSAFEQNGAVIISAEVELFESERAAIEEKMKDILGRRKDKQPLELPSAGSAFKRPENGFAAAMIDECGLKGFSIGGAQVSEKHAGFVVNKGGASCDDVLRLLDAVRERVFAKTGIMLEPEIKYIGN